MNKVYLAGKITGDDNYKEKFKEVETMLIDQDCKVMNPAILPEGFNHDEYLHICFAMIEVCDTVMFLDDWEDSPGAKAEHDLAKLLDKKIIYEVR